MCSSDLADITEGATESLTFEALSGLDLADLAKALPSTTTLTETRPGHYRVDGSVDARALATITAWCAQHDVQPRNISSGRHGLEEHFWQVTGHQGERSSAAGP